MITDEMREQRHYGHDNAAELDPCWRREGKEMTVIELAELLKTIDDQNQTIKVAIREDGIAPVTGDIEDIGFNPKGDAWILAVPER